jgi:sigma-B regulation protein RsbU (phosphoserine phosphatase)
MSEPGPIDEYRDLFENAPCGYLTIGADGRISKANATLEAWTGFSADKFIGRRLHQFLNMAGRIYFETHIAPLLRMQGFFNEFALDFETSAGERLPVIANAAERRNSDGNLLFTALVVIRATDRRRYERELVDSRSELRKGLATERETAELREQFIAVLGHDLRNPLAAISAGARILQRSGALQEQKELRVLDMINTTVTRMSDLIDNVLDFARGRLGGGITLSRDANRPLDAVLEQVVDELRTASPERVIETDIAITESVNCDRTRVGQLVSNLIGNALTHGSADEPVRVGARTEDGLFKLWVANAGEPIPAPAMHKLFEPFFRGNVRDSRQGLGLGLHIASQIAQAHGGTIAVTSTPKETRFVFTMPLHE